MGGWSGTAFQDGIIYAGTADGRVVAINASSRIQEWEYAITMPSSGTSCGPSVVSAPMYSTPIVDGDLVYIGTYSGEVYALSTVTGARRWFYPEYGSMGAIVGSPVIANDTMYVSSSDGSVYALNASGGDLRWEDRLKWRSEPLADKLWVSPAAVGDTVYVTTYDGHIYALSVETGEMMDWSFESEAGFASSPEIYDDTIFVGSFDRHLYAVKIGSDVLQWRFPEDPAGNWFWATPVVNEGTVYAGCLDGTLYAIDARTGEEEWSYETQDERGKPSPIVSSPVLMDNELIVINESGVVYVFNLDRELGNGGTPWWTTPLGTDVKSAFCAQGGLVYVRGEDNRLYVVDIEKREVSWNFLLTKKEE
jgi:outer membrane protein assembly factor BamB